MIQSKIKKINAQLLPHKLLYAPDWLVLGVNNICNLHCKMCDVGTKTNETNFATNLVGTHPLHMPLELIQKIMDQAAEYYPQVKIGYAFTEPLVYKHLIESLAYAKSKKLYTSITTNALTLKQKADDISNAGIHDIFVSLDGPQDIHNMIRGHKSSFQRAIEGIEVMLAKNVDISVFCVITEWNIGHLKAFADFFKKYPLKQLGYMHTNYTPQFIADQHNKIYGEAYPATASNVEESNVDNIDLKLLWEEIAAIKKSKYPFPVTFSPEVTSEEALAVFYREPSKLMGKRCQDAFSNIMIKSDGSVIPAHGRCYNLTAGNLYDNNLKEIWNSKVLGNFRKTLNQSGGLLPACSRCCSAFGN